MSITNNTQTFFIPKTLSIVLAIGWALLIFAASHSSNTANEGGLLTALFNWIQTWLPFDLASITNLDKLVHAIIYALLALFVFGTNHRFLLTLVLCSLYGISDEYHQSFIAGRDSDVWDWLADTVGASLSLIAIWIFSRKPEK